jgi:hypothetical protein
MAAFRRTHFDSAPLAILAAATSGFVTELPVEEQPHITKIDHDETAARIAGTR